MPRIAWLEPAPGCTGSVAPTTEGARPGFRFAQSLTTLRDGMEPGDAFGAARRRNRCGTSFSMCVRGGAGEARSSAV